MSGWGKVWGCIPPKTEVEIPNEMITVTDGAVTTIPKFKNTPPTHDPYTNPNSYIYYQCSCGEVLDPGTKSFAALNNAAMNNGWKIRWGDNHYIPYCVKCGEKVE